MGRCSCARKPTNATAGVGCPGRSRFERTPNQALYLPVNLVWCVPISSAECEHKLEYGAASLYDLFQARQHPLVFNGDRKSYI